MVVVVVAVTLLLRRRRSRRSKNNQNINDSYSPKQSSVHGHGELEDLVV